MDHDSGKGIYRYCGQENEQIAGIFSKIKSRTKISSMIDISIKLKWINSRKVFFPAFEFYLYLLD
jgi:hypothetical protein